MASTPSLLESDELDTQALLSDVSSTVTILHIDDDPAFTDLVATFLEHEQEYFDVVSETDPEAAVEMASERDVDCIVCDYDMPMMNGLDVLEAVRADCPKLPFVLFTGKGSEEIASEAISAGVTEYLQKEAGNEQYQVLANRIEQAVARNRAESHVERGFRAIEAAHDGISLLDEDGRFVYVNESYADTVGYERSELLGRHWKVLYPEEEHDRVVEEMLPTARNRQWVGETEYVTKGGGTVTVDHRLTYVPDDTLICTISEVGDDALKEELALKERALDEAPIGVTIADPSEPDTPMVYANDGFLDLTGYDRSDVLGRNCRFLQGEDTRADAVDQLAAGIDDAEPTEVELRNERADGTAFWNRVTVTPLTDDDGEPEYFVGFQEDVTVRRELLDEFGSLADVLSHDMQNPLQTVRGRLRFALESGDMDHVEKALPSLDRLDELIDDVADALESGTIVGEREPVDVGDLAEEIWDSLDRRETAESLRVEGSPTVEGDTVAVRRMFDNILRNSLEHGDAPLEVRIGELDDGFYVEDNGPGVPEPNRERIFEQGFSTKESDDGTGLGMASVRQIVLAHEWRIDAEAATELSGVRFEIRT